MNNKKFPIVGTVIIVSVFLFVLIQNKNNNQVSNASQGLVQPETSNTTQFSIYTINDVAKHNNKSDCWTTINGGVYNVTPWISQHPGGSEAIISLCGIDGSDGFNGQHGGQKRPASELASFKIGVLK